MTICDFCKKPILRSLMNQIVIMETKEDNPRHTFELCDECLIDAIKYLYGKWNPEKYEKEMKK